MTEVTNDFYTDVYMGVRITDGEELQRCINESIEILNDYTYGRIDTEELTEFQEMQTKLAICYEADFINKYSDVINSPVNSFSVGGVSMSLDGQNISKCIDSSAKRLLKRAGLLCTILR